MAARQNTDERGDRDAERGFIADEFISRKYAGNTVYKGFERVIELRPKRAVIVRPLLRKDDDKSDDEQNEQKQCERIDDRPGHTDNDRENGTEVQTSGHQNILENIGNRIQKSDRNCGGKIE